MMGEGEYPFVSILVAVKDMAGYIGDCLDALLRLDYPKDKYEIIVMVEDNSTDWTAEIVAGYEPPVRCIMVNFRSPAKAYNHIIEKAKGDILGFVDGDANVDKNWLKRAVEPLKDPKVAGASGTILTQNKGFLISRIIGYELQDRYERMPRKIKRVATMHVVYKKKVLKEVGGFNEKLKTGYDCEVGYKINDAGYDIIFVPDAKVYHNHRGTISSYFKQQFTYGYYAALRYLENPEIAKGDEVTPLWMIVQPLIYLTIAFLLLSSLVFSRGYKFPIIPIALLAVAYTYSALRIAIKYHDISALLLVVLYTIRPIGWGLGGAKMGLHLLKSYLLPNRREAIWSARSP